MNENASHISKDKEEEDEAHPEEHHIDTSKFTEMNNEEGDNVTVNHTVMVKIGTMDDVFIIDKAATEEIQAVLYLHSLVPKIKKFTYDLRFNHSVLTSPYMKEFEDILT